MTRTTPTLQGLASLTVPQIRASLRSSGITHPSNALKADILPLLALKRLGIIDKDTAADPELLEKVTRWCGLRVGELKEELRERGLEEGVNKWAFVEVLILGELDDEGSGDTDDEEEEEEEEEDDEDENEIGSEDEHKDEPEVEAGPSKQLTRSTPKSPTATVANLLLTLFYADTVSYPEQFRAACPECPFKTAAALAKVLQTMPLIKDTQHLTSLSKNPTISDTSKLISWLCSTFGSDIIEATAKSGFKVPGFPDSVPQFVLVKPVKKHRDAFSAHLKASKGKSMLLFHGAPLRHLSSMLRNGFRPSSDLRHGPGLFMAEQPIVSYPFAAKEAVGAYAPARGWCWPNSPFQGCGMLLGCEVAGGGRPVADGPGIHVVNKMDSVVVRYVFLLDAKNTASAYGAAGAVPVRAVVEPAMAAAFKVIHKGIDISTLGDGDSDEDEEEEGEEREGSGTRF